jgi:hypothetical protein
MGNKRKYIEKIIAERAKNEVEALAIRQEIGFPTPTVDLPNLKKDRLVLELVNRTNEATTIDLFGLPAGINPSQGIEYGDLFQTKYCSVVVPISELSLAQTYTINWNDEDGVPQTATTASLTGIDTLILELNAATSDAWGYYVDGTNYVIHKEPIDTWVYWTPPPTSTSGGTPTTLSTIPFTPTSGKKTIRATSGSNRLFLLQNNSLFSWAYPPSVVGSSLTVPLPFASSNVVAYDSTNSRVLVYGNNSFALYDDIPSAVPIASGTWLSVGTIATVNGLIWDAANQIWWAIGGETAPAQDNPIYIFDKDMVLLDTWTNPELLGIKLMRDVFGGQLIQPMPNGDIWTLSGRQLGGLATSGIYKIGGYNSNTQTIIKTVQTFYPSQASSVSFLNMKDATTDGTYLWGISGNSFGNLARFRYNLSNGDAVWVEDSGMQTLNGIYHSPSFDRIFIHTETNGNGIYGVYAFDDATLAIDSSDLVNNAFTSFTATFFWDETNQTAYKSNSAPQGFSGAVTTAPPTTIPSGSKEESFYTENEFIDLTADGTPNTYLFSCFDVIGGTGISVSETTGNIPYYELVNALRTNLEPYFFTDMTVYADNVAQANTPIEKVIRGAKGVERTTTNYPAILYQEQFVVQEPISIAPRALNEIDYRLNPFESVRIIINYTKGDLNAIAEILDVYVSQGIPFVVALDKLPSKVSEKEEEYLKTTLESIWSRKKRDLAAEGVEIDIESIFAPREIVEEKREVLGKKMSIVRKHLEEQKIKQAKMEEVSPSNIKKLIGDYIAKGGADEINDSYNYGDGSR